MSLLGIIVKSLTPYAQAVAAEVAGNAVDKVIQKLEEKAKEQEKKLFKKQSGTELLVMIKQQVGWRDKYDIFDENREVKYIVKGELVSIKHQLHVFDAQGNELGRIKEKLISLRMPLSGEVDPVDFVIEIGGTKKGTVRSKGAFGKELFEVDFNGWHLERKAFKMKYKILEGDEEIANISQKHLSSCNTYVINFPDPNNEFLVMIMAIALDAAIATRRAKYMSRTLHDSYTEE